MTIKLTMKTTPQMIYDAAIAAGAKAAKLYPIGATTNSEDGIYLERLTELKPVFEALADCKMLLLVHAEDPSSFPLNKEADSIRHIQQILELAESNLRIVVEHVSCSKMAAFVASGPKNLAATVTAHHLYLTLNDVLGKKLCSDYFCMPIVKTPEDRESLFYYIRASKKFIFGSDRAPHPDKAKECRACSAGVFIGAEILPLVVQMFEQNNMLHVLNDFLSVRGCDFYNLPRPKKTITFEKHDEPVSFEEANSVLTQVKPMPLREDDKLYWRIVS